MMIELIRLEWRKQWMGRIVPAVLWAMLIIMALLVLFVYIGEWEKEPMVHSLSEWLRFADVLVRGCYIVFAAVLISRLVVGEYAQKTVQLMFTYPIGRKHLMYAKLLIVFFFTFVTVLVANVVIGAGIIALNHVLQLVPVDLNWSELPIRLLIVCAQAAGTAGISCLPIIVAMRKKTAPATIVSSLIVVLIVCSDNTGFSLGNIWAVTLVLGLVGAIGAWLSMRRVEHEDIS